jgi:excinuclease ABC subunit C
MPSFPKHKIPNIPDAPGIYQFIDADGKILYVGKAKNLKKRITSYFTKNVSVKTSLMLKKSVDIQYIVTQNETEAFLLENVLIKKHQPRYNVLLKDDKTYPWIVIRNEAYPRVEMTRDWAGDGSEYFGPYASVRTVKVLIDLIHDLYPVRTCRYDLSEQNIKKGKFKVCLEYHLGRCNAPCVGEETPGKYNEYLKNIRRILKGDFKPALDYFRKEMLAAAERMEFEKAQAVKERIETLERYQARSTVVNPKIGNVEVYSILSDTGTAYVNFMEVANGAVIRVHNLEIKKRLDESDRDLLAIAITELRQRFKTAAKEMILPFKLDLPFDVKQSVPKRGDKLKLLDLSLKNAKYYRLEKLKRLKQTDPEAHSKRILEQMKSDLRLKKPPVHIECFDISHTQGVEKTASCVVFKNAKPDKKSYRHFKIKTVAGNNDFASMEEVIYRRYKRLRDEGEALPDLIVIDGGKGQLSAALKSLKTLGMEHIPIISIAKRLEEIYRPGDAIPLYLDKQSETLKVLQQIRNEAHRFGLKLHRKRRQKKSVSVSLTAIPGIGEKTAVKLLKHFKSVKRIKAAPLEEIQKVVGKSYAQIIKEHLK